MTAQLKIYSDSACLNELLGTPYSLDFGNFKGVTGETKTTSILVKNTGAAINTNVVLTETSDVGARVQYSLDDITYNQTTITLGDMGVGDVIRVYIKVTVTASTSTLFNQQVTFDVTGDGAGADVIVTYNVLTLIDDIKLTLRISSATTEFDVEINDLVDAVKAELGLAGVLDNAIIDTDTLIKRAIITYVKANFGWNNPDMEKLQKAYEYLRNHLTLSSDYSFYAIDFVITDGTAGVRSVVTLNDVIKDTNADGEVRFYVRAGNNYEYTVEAEGYTKVDDVIDVKQHKTVSLVVV